MKRFLSVDWDAVAGISAAVAALVLHFLHIVQADALLAMMLLLLALLLLRDLRREHHQERLTERAERTETAVMKIQTALHPPDAVLIWTIAVTRCERTVRASCSGGDGLV
jgi:uncharacterized membrane protein YfcA